MLAEEKEHTLSFINFEYLLEKMFQIFNVLTLGFNFEGKGGYEKNTGGLQLVRFIWGKTKPLLFKSELIKFITKTHEMGQKVGQKSTF